jgi:hypothetical protein
MNKCIFSWAFVIILALAGSKTANASITVGLPTVTSGVWNYGMTGDTLESLVAGNSYFVIYDFSGYVVGSITAPTGWTATAQLVGPVPPNQILTDSSSLYNLVFSYTGATTPVPTMSGFTAESIYNSIATGGTFAYQATNNANGLPDQGQGFVDIPVAAPEPTTISLFCGGLALLGLSRLRRK